jgi:hypothetical protein
MPPESSTHGKCPEAVHIFELALVGAFPTTGQFGTAASASLKYHMEEMSVLAALPLYSCTGFLSSFLPFLMFKLRVLSATGAILEKHKSDRKLPQNGLVVGQWSHTSKHQCHCGGE